MSMEAILALQRTEFLFSTGAAAVRSILFAELMAVLHGLQICWESGFRRVTCFSDSLQTVNLIRDGVSAYHRFANEVVFNIRQLLLLR
ncbi:ribonuclease H [Trifolium pratense]|uniref:Ribonuclease H n=1 Tax=Trifolium pratense TaxID=57577 RepID=A0A2K3KPP3_TRIPR|nr:ribonuclease H [Trifolium pratense]